MSALQEDALQPIRPADAADIKDIFALNRLSFREAWSETALQEALERGYDLRVWRTTDGRLAAYYLAQNVVDEVHILQLAVAPAWRRLGVGSELTRQVLADMRHRGMRKAFLEVRQSNRPAQQMYTQLGFKCIGRRQGYYSVRGMHAEDALVMARTL